MIEAGVADAGHDAGEPDPGHPRDQPRHDRTAQGPAGQRPGDVARWRSSTSTTTGPRSSSTARAATPGAPADAGAVGPGAQGRRHRGPQSLIDREIDWATKYQPDRALPGQARPAAVPPADRPDGPRLPRHPPHPRPVLPARAAPARSTAVAHEPRDLRGQERAAADHPGPAARRVHPPAPRRSAATSPSTGCTSSSTTRPSAPCCARTRSRPSTSPPRLGARVADKLIASMCNLRISVLVAAVALCGCAVPDTSPAKPADPGPLRPAAGGADLLAEAQLLEQPMVLDRIPDGLELRARQDDVGSQSEHSSSLATLYADHTPEETLDGPVLLEGTSSGTAAMARPHCGLPVAALTPRGRRGLCRPGGRPDLGRRGRSRLHGLCPVRRRPWAGGGADRGRSGRRLQQDHARPGARRRPRRSDTADRRQPFRRPLRLAGGRAVHAGGRVGRVEVSAVRVEPRLAALWGFWTDDAAGAVIRGHAGSRGDLHGTRSGTTPAVTSGPRTGCCCR